ncbi:hypothetical protein LWI29_038567 [Acer saccharum]|uniref:Uncharacterized protein n=1 Tax=Acer saccharum TaxID=4024 RepID=A0AA39SG60_ACESA|nr:hypothetical protein LWI29_038567 [Acer saccharum]
MDALLAPGPDGFSSRFFQHCLEIVGRDVILTVQDFFHSGMVALGLNSNFVRFLVCLGIYSISKRVFLVMFSSLSFEDSRRQRKSWPQFMQDAGFKEKCASSVYEGLEHVLIQCLIEFRSFRLLIHKVSSPNVLTMPLYVLLRCVDFIDDFRDDFSTVFQSCIVVFVRERVMVCNPKMDSNSEFGRSRYGPTNRGCAGEDSPARGPHGLAVVEAVGPTAWSTFCSRVGHAPPTAWG